jgi:hypothetical protein
MNDALMSLGELQELHDALDALEAGLSPVVLPSAVTDFVSSIKNACQGEAEPTSSDR